MAVVTATPGPAPAPSRSLIETLQAPMTVVTLLSIMWVCLCLFVMGGKSNLIELFNGLIAGLDAFVTGPIGYIFGSFGENPTTDAIIGGVIARTVVLAGWLGIIFGMAMAVKYFAVEIATILGIFIVGVVALAFLYGVRQGDVSDFLEIDLGEYILLPAIPCVFILYFTAMYSWRESWIAMLGATLVFFWLFCAVLAPYLPLVDPNKPIAPFTLPGVEKRDHYFLLGADYKGRDLLSRVIWGCQRVLVWGVTATAVAYAVGSMLGLLAGYLSGWWDEVISFIANVLLAFPVLILFILILTYLGPSGFNIIIAVTFASAPAIMRIVRGLTLDTKTRDYIFAAQTRGESPLWIMIVELLPNARGPIIVDACLRLGYTTVAITTLTFFGLGLQPPDPDWGLMIRESINVAKVDRFAYMLLVPTLAVSTLILGFNLLADGLREMSLRD